MDEAKFFHGFFGQDEGVDIGQAHAAVEFVQGVRQGHPVPNDLIEVRL